MQNQGSTFFKNITYWHIGYFFLWIFVAAIPFSKAVSGIGEAAAGIVWLFSLRYPAHKHAAKVAFTSLTVMVLPILWLFFLFNGFFAQDTQQTIADLNQRHYLFTVPILLATFAQSKTSRLWLLYGLIAGTAVTLCIMFGMQIVRYNPDAMKHSPTLEGVRCTELNEVNPFAFTRSVALAKGDTLYAQFKFSPSNAGIVWVVANQNPETFTTIIDNNWVKAKAFWIARTDTIINNYLFLYKSEKAFVNGLGLSKNEQVLYTEAQRVPIDLPSPYIQRPRMGVLLAFCSLLAIWFFLRATKRTHQFFLAFLSIFFVVGLFVLKGVLGQIAFIVALLLLLIAKMQQFNFVRFFFWAGLIFVFAALIGFVSEGMQQHASALLHVIREKTASFDLEAVKVSSIKLRLHYWHNTWQLFLKEPWSIGPFGDWRLRLSPIFELFTPGLGVNRPHNQFLELWLIGGFPALLWFIYGWILTIRQSIDHKPIVWAVHLLLFLSCMVDDTLATQTGVSIFALIFAMYLKPLYLEKSKTDGF